MSTFSVTVEVGGVEGERFESIEALIATGSSHSIFPARLLHDLGIEPRERWPFWTVAGTQLEMDVATVVVRIAGRMSPTSVVFGDNDVQARIGFITLAALCLAIDQERLVPVPGLLLSPRAVVRP